VTVACILHNHCQGVGSGWWYDDKAFLIAAAGAAIGTWLSFSIRRVELSFSQLAILEEDVLDPSVRRGRMRTR
jgi:hypothetical protein